MNYEQMAPLTVAAAPPLVAAVAAVPSVGSVGSALVAEASVGVLPNLLVLRAADLRADELLWGVGARGRVGNGSDKLLLHEPPLWWLHGEVATSGSRRHSEKLRRGRRDLAEVRRRHRMRVVWCTKIECLD